MNKEELLEEAKRRYPIGTKVVCLFSGDVCGIKSQLYVYHLGNVWIDSGKENAMVFDGEKWADTIRSQMEDKYTKEQVVEFCRYILRTEYAEDLDEETTTELFDLWLLDLWIESKKPDI